VIAYGKGGVLETVIPLAAGAEKNAAPNGVFFWEQTPRDLIKAVEFYQRMQSLFEPAQIREHAAQFSAQRFREQVHEYIQARLSERWE
jgi:hypothetical protein